MKKHPAEMELALYAGNDLALSRTLAVRLHVLGCADCRRTLESYQQTRQVLKEMPEPVTGAAWDRLAAEMEANINLGLEASQCIRFTGEHEPEEPDTWRPVLACALALVLVATAVWWNRPQAMQTLSNTGVVMSAGPDAIEVQQDGQTMGLLHIGAQSVTYSAKADGEIGARYVDEDTGYVMIQNVVASD